MPLLPAAVRARPILLSAVGLMVVLCVFLPHDWPQTTRILVAWNSGVAFHLLGAASMMRRSTLGELRRRAAEDEGKIAILFLTIISAVASFAAIVGELATAKSFTGLVKGEHIALAGMTVFLSWSFMQMIFALHYAHEYYDEENGTTKKGLDFPGTADPDYSDFVYFAFIIGTAAQTADVNITSSSLRRVVTLHCLIVFFFNVMILALLVNIAASLF